MAQAQLPAPLRMQVPVTMRALVQRINRRLATEHQVLKKARGSRALDTLGTYYVVNWYVNRIEQLHVEPVALAKDLGVLAAWETVDEDED